MTQNTNVRALLLAALVTIPGYVAAAPSPEQTCARMISDGRANGMDQAICLCVYRVAEEVLDANIRALLFDSWYTGRDNMAAVQQLPRQGRVTRQMGKMQRTAARSCPGAF
ncbi:hypothetical protein [uncultured Roseobacter sp.]|uniref:hypothetical protein n=1 Tax=uncultured Roseobacter sp. TaxID=114847 RepID=UPI00262FE486|nr:hypothetical protein [uncultured Roseobacter sp.]